MNQQVKAGITAIKDFLSGKSSEAEPVPAEDKATRDEVAAELVAAMSGPNPGADAALQNDSIKTGSPASDVTDPQESTQAAPATNAATAEHNESLSDQEQERARQLFLDHGYFDEAVHNLRAANSPAERAAAARALGLVGNQRGTAHLIAALFDEDAEVRQAAEEAIHQIENPTAGAPSAGSDENNVETQQIEILTTTEASVAVDDNQVEATAQVLEAAPEQIVEATVPVAVDAVPETVTEEAQTSTAPEDVTADLSPVAASGDEEQLLAQEHSINQSVAEIGRQLSETMAAFKQAEDEARSRIEREAQLRAEAIARRVEEEDLRRRTEEEAAARRAEEREALRAEQSARVQAEAESQRLADEETKLRLKAASLRLDAAEVARRRADMETARKEAIEAAREAEARRDRDEARSRHEAEVQRLRGEEETLQQAREEARQQQTNLQVVRERLTSDIERLKEEQAAAEASHRDEAERLRAEGERRNHEAQEQLRLQMEDLRRAEAEVSHRRSEVEAAREKSDAEAQRLLEAQARMRAAEEARAEAERERAQLEAEIKQQVEAQLQLLEETRRRGQAEHERVQEELRLESERQQQRLSEVELLRTKAEVESAQRAEKERQIRAQIDSLRIADAETRRRIEDAEVRRRATEDAYRLVAEKVQRVEAEAHAREKEEERMLAKLEAERKTVAIEAQSRTEQEKRIREEIAMFRRLEDEQRPLIEKATLELADIENRLQEGKERLRAMEEAHAEATQELAMVSAGRVIVPEETSPDEGRATEVVRTEFRQPAETTASAPETLAEPQPDLADVDVDQSLSPGVTPAIATYLKSVDPYKRAAAVAELARTGSGDAFSRITDCFDDPSPHVRNAAARALRKLEPERTVDMFNRALETGSAERRQNIGAAIAASGLAAEAINNLASSSREESYNALSILFVMAKTGEIQPLVQALEEHKTDEIGKAVAKLLSLSGHHGGHAAGGAGSA